MKELIYLDHAAATPLSENALREMMPYFFERFHNPSSPYMPAVEVRREYEAAKDRIGSVIGAKGSDLVMTAGATESINLAFSCAVGEEVLISEIEHESVKRAAEVASVCERAKVDKYGVVDVEDVKARISEKTKLVSVALVSGELGTIQPVSEISQLVKEERIRRMKGGDDSPIYLHVDASQGLGLLDVSVARLGVDMLTLNAAKIYGPKQVGLLWIKPGVRLKPVVAGGGQEMGLRSGTENVAGVIGFARAAVDAKAHVASERKRLGELKKTMKQKLESGLVDVVFLGHERKQLVSFLPILVPGTDAERLMFLLEEKGVLVSTGAACAANKGVRSGTLKAIGLSDEEADASLRISLGRLNTKENVMKAAEFIIEAVVAERERVGVK